MDPLQGRLFDVADADVALTTDEWYTPPWVFTAAGLTFDVDVAAPTDHAYRTCPASWYLTAADDGLTAWWDGLVWMNPPYSKAGPWVRRFVDHPDGGLALLPALPEVTWRGLLLHHADAAALVAPEFGRPDGSVARLRWPCILAGRGPVAAAAVARVAGADHYAAGAYLVHPREAAG